MQLIADFINSPRHSNDEPFVMLFLGPEAEWDPLWTAVKHETERSYASKDHFEEIVDGQSWPFPGIYKSFSDYDVLQKPKDSAGKEAKAPNQTESRVKTTLRKTWFNDRVTEFRFPKKLEPQGQINSLFLSLGLEEFKQHRLSQYATFGFFLKK
jgi:hypothetical protein